MLVDGAEAATGGGEGAGTVATSATTGGSKLRAGDRLGVGLFGVVGSVGATGCSAGGVVALAKVAGSDLPKDRSIAPPLSVGAASASARAADAPEKKATRLRAIRAGDFMGGFGGGQGRQRAEGKGQRASFSRAF
ncbi:hypothetical protein AVDCRST_MAG94-6231 [uncultured Leptolyngbya sp.]|uniref:Uncharacterized protein n=1 Tax=uncultured Leptolyngbya sp. TaxID=332963 RepID=A0A6J4P600_9CYAN|nr:hypothetical protein AVDCRST_MAG94-6231 [uncultured Leptolyngbya sp.]